MPVDYQLGKIYRLDCLTTGLCYVGSTAQPTLAKRLGDHVKNYKHWITSNEHYCSSFEILKSNNYQITLIEDYPCENKDQLTKQERFYTNQIECVNIIKNQGIFAELGGKQGYMKHYTEQNREQITIKNRQYYETNKELIIEQHKQYRRDNKEQVTEKDKHRYETKKESILKQRKQYYEKNREQIAEQKKQHFSCVCGGCYQPSSKAKHVKTQKHQNYLAILKTNELTTSI